MTFRDKMIKTIKHTVLLMVVVGCAFMIYLCLEKGNWIAGLIGFPLLVGYFGDKLMNLYVGKRTFEEY